MAFKTYLITAEDIEGAKEFFGEDEHYIMMSDLTQARLDKLSTIQALDEQDFDDFLVRFMLAVTDWNGNAYGTGRKSAMLDYHKIAPIFKKHWQTLLEFRSRTNLITLTESDHDSIINAFNDFDSILSHVGTAKSFHLIAPRFFIAWDNAIKKGYGLGDSGKHYLNFLQATKKQIVELEQSGYPIENNILKLIDQFNFWHFTRNRNLK
ncbi:MAG: hypothetical protein Phog2KO_42170 [Phototrophicaceae bacterium]